MFEVFLEKEVVDDVGEVMCYGIKSPGGQVIHNLCVNQAETESFVQALNQAQASEVHFMDLVEDFLLWRLH